jgi:hypothetical protein
MAKASKSPSRKPAASRKNASGKKPPVPEPAAAPVPEPAAAPAIMPFAADAAEGGNKKLAIGLVVTAALILTGVGVWWFLIRKTDTSSMPAKKDNTPAKPVVNPACLKKGSFPAGFPSVRTPIPAEGTDICKETLMINKAASLDQKTLYTIHNDCFQKAETAGSGILKSADGTVKFIYNPVSKTYKVETGGCQEGLRYRLCAFDNGTQKALWLRTTEPETGPTTKTTENWKTGARSCNWDLVSGTDGGYSLRVPDDAETVPLRRRYFGAPITPPDGGIWKNENGENYYAVGNIVEKNTSESTFILSPYVVAK